MTRARENADLPVAMTESNGLVGIGSGNSAPDTVLDVAAAGVPLELRATNSNTYKVQLGGSSGYDGYWGTAQNVPFIVANSSVSEMMRIDSSGRVTMPNQPYIVLQGNYSGNTTWNQSDIIGATDFGTSAFAVPSYQNMTYNSNTGRITVPVAGVYMVHLCTYYNGGSTATLRVQIQKNGSNNSMAHDTAGFDGTLHVTQLVPMAANDYIRFQHASGSDRAFYEGINHTYAFIMKTA